MNSILLKALIDKKLSPLEFRVLVYITENIENVYLEQLKQELNIKTFGTMSKIIKSLISKGYISRKRLKGGTQKGKAPYEYKINTAKSKLPRNDSFDTYFIDIYKVYDFFLEKIKPHKINESEAIRNIRLLLHKDKYKSNHLINVIEEISNSNELKNKIKSIFGLRKYLKEQEA